jgi:hypothetical protein
MMRGKVYDDIFPTHFEYLHYSYFKANQLEQAIKCALSFLLFYPDDELMLDNLKLYMSYQNEVASGVIDEPRVEAKEYLERLEYEKQILAYVFEKFGGKLHSPELPKRFDDEVMEALVSYGNPLAVAITQPIMLVLCSVRQTALSSHRPNPRRPHRQHHRRYVGLGTGIDCSMGPLLVESNHDCDMNNISTIFFNSNVTIVQIFSLYFVIKTFLPTYVWQHETKTWFE